MPNFNIDSGHVIPGLIHNCYIAQKNNTPFIIWGSGRCKQQFFLNASLRKCTQ